MREAGEGQERGEGGEVERWRGRKTAAHAHVRRPLQKSRTLFFDGGVEAESQY